MSKKKKKNLSLIIIIIICLIGIIYCGKNLLDIYLDYHTSDVEYNNLTDEFVKETKNPEITDKNSQEIDEDTYPFVEIDWEGLKKINPDIVAWIRIPGTVVDYPVVQGKTNDDYIHTTFEGKTPSSAAAIFLDYRNSGRLDDYVSVMYGHNMKNGSMFSILKKYLKEDFLNENKYIEIYTPYWSKVYTPTFIYTSHFLDGAYDFTIRNDETYLEYLKARDKQSYIHPEKLDVDKNSIVLSTCYGKSGTEYRCLVILTPSSDIEPIYFGE